MVKLKKSTNGEVSNTSGVKKKKGKKKEKPEKKRRGKWGLITSSIALFLILATYGVTTLVEVQQLKVQREVYAKQVELLNKVVKNGKEVADKHGNALVESIVKKGERPEFLQKDISLPLLSPEEVIDFENYTVLKQNVYSSVGSKTSTHLIIIVGYEHSMSIEAVWLEDKIIYLKTVKKPLA